MCLLEVERLGISYPGQDGQFQALAEVNLQMRAGEFVAIIGPSGCGKTTLLGALAGLLPPGARQSGIIHWDGRLRRRGALGYLTQRDTLLPWRTVLANVELPLELHGLPRQVRRRQALEMLERFGLAGFERSYPHELSGGMRQRVSLARTLIYDPELIALDEPLGSLDAQTRLVLQEELRRLWRETHQTFLLVTHDLEEAVLLAERVIVLSARPGRVVAEHKIELDRKRSLPELRWSAEFSRITRRLWQELNPQTKSLERSVG